ncbi:HAMP domain-containing histidine kinase [Lysobacter sp. KIS68-7]|uniref:sensor histidine kinase n=1 Tax=Lysobacter sp. KIS68-7 TaxID=2904252 RepID=UPI001E2F16E1|nr:HAMP domain-containing sensor histidine kinase [Lysobacter sp. KIS68-7]UHQ20752.1 HAMP domain-containing histidine kinase [Lysobacter sp. KIS68-7]
MQSEGTDTPWFDRLAHDLRGPLTSLQTAAYLLRTDPGGANSKELADIVVRQSQRMARMIEELDDWGRAQQKRLVDRSERLELEVALDMAIASQHAYAIDPQYDADARGLFVQGDATRLTQLFRTLLLHVAGRDAASACVKVSRHDGRAHVAFCDRGPALDATVRERLLQVPQVPPPDDGLGLRLLIAKAIAEGHGGTLGVDAPREDESLCMRCTFPLAE